MPTHVPTTEQMKARCASCRYELLNCTLDIFHDDGPSQEGSCLKPLTYEQTNLVGIGRYGNKAFQEL